MEEKNRAALPVTQEEFEAMRQRYARELMTKRRSVDAILDQNGLRLPQEEETEPIRYDCQGDPVPQPEPVDSTEPDSDEYDAENGELPPDEIEELTPPDAEMPQLTDTGTIQVTVSAAQDAVPIEGAAVLISREEDGIRTLIQAMITDSSGKTPILTVPAPSRTLTEEPGNTIPFAVYRAAVTAPGFLPLVNDNVTVFGGSAALFTAALQPKPQPEVPPPGSEIADGSLLF